MRDVLVAQVRTHAMALLRWSKLDEAVWKVVLYGEKIDEIFNAALVARPITDVTEAQAYWFACELRPRVMGAMRTYAGWQPVIPTPHQIAAPLGPELTQNPMSAWC